MAHRLTTTSYAVLGFLSLQPWTTYELAKNMRRNFHFFWQRAESALYEEPKALVRAGLAKAVHDRVGARGRTTYSITPKGRRALASWLATPCAPPALDAEALVRIFFARAGKPGDLASCFTQARALADDIQAIGRSVAREFLDGTAPHREQPHLNAMVFDFLWTWADTLRAWSERWQPEIAKWDDTRADVAKKRRALATFRARTEP